MDRDLRADMCFEFYGCVNMQHGVPIECFDAVEPGPGRDRYGKCGLVSRGRALLD